MTALIFYYSFCLIFIKHKKLTKKVAVCVTRGVKNTPFNSKKNVNTKTDTRGNTTEDNVIKTSDSFGLSSEVRIDPVTRLNQDVKYVGENKSSAVTAICIIDSSVDFINTWTNNSGMVSNINIAAIEIHPVAIRLAL